jgi:hypothetical protein
LTNRVSNRRTFNFRQFSTSHQGSPLAREEEKSTDESGDFLHQEFREKRNALLQNAVEKWQEKYDGNAKGNRFRELGSWFEMHDPFVKAPTGSIFVKLAEADVEQTGSVSVRTCTGGCMVSENGQPIC